MLTRLDGCRPAASPARGLERDAHARKADLLEKADAPVTDIPAASDPLLLGADPVHHPAVTPQTFARRRGVVQPHLCARHFLHLQRVSDPAGQRAVAAGTAGLLRNLDDVTDANAHADQVEAGGFVADEPLIDL